MQIAGLDPSTKKLAFVGATERRGKSWSDAVPLLRPGQTYEPMLAGDIFATTYEIVVTHQVDHLYIEAPLLGVGGVRTAVVLGYVAGAAQAGAIYGGAEVHLVHVQEWKKTVAKGNASKHEVALAVRHLWPMMYRAVEGDQDLIDAAAICWHGIGVVRELLVA